MIVKGCFVSPLVLCFLFFFVLVLALLQRILFLEQQLKNRENGTGEENGDEKSDTQSTTNLSSMSKLRKQKASFGFSFPTARELRNITKMKNVGKNIDIYKKQKDVVSDKDEPKKALVQQGLLAVGAKEGEFLVFDCDRNLIRKAFTSVPIDYTEKVIKISKNPDIIVCKNGAYFREFTDIFNLDYNELSQSQQKKLKPRFDKLWQTILDSSICILDSKTPRWEKDHYIKRNEHEKGIQQLAIYDLIKSKSSTNSKPIAFHSNLMTDNLEYTVNYAYLFGQSQEGFGARVRELDCETMFRWMLALGRKDNKSTQNQPKQKKQVFPDLPSWYQSKSG